MHIYMRAHHAYPARSAGPGGGRVFDCLAKGLAELGHEVSYQLLEGARESLPEGVNLVSEPVWDADIVHLRSDSELWREAQDRSRVWVATCHTDLDIWNLSRGEARANWIYVSRHLAKTYGSQRYILNGIDPDEFMYSDTKDTYVLFVCALRLAREKGLEMAIAYARDAGFPLVVAGSSPEPERVLDIAALCRQHQVSYVGEIQGARKAELFAGARALLFPTQINESFGLVIVTLSSTQICRHGGACPEVMTPEVGFVCADDADYHHALAQVHTIQPAACRAKAMRDYHYLRMAQDYVGEYTREISTAPYRERMVEDVP